MKLLWIIATAGLSSTLAAQVPTDSTGSNAVTPSEPQVQVRVNGQPTGEPTIGTGLVTIDTVRVVVKAGDQVKTLLRRRGIVPDAAAIGRFYELNPAVSNADELTVGSSVLLPSVTASDSLSQNTEGRVSVAFVADTAYKGLLIEHAARLAVLTDSLHRMNETLGRTQAFYASSLAIERGVVTLAKASVPLSSETAAELTRGLRDYRVQVEAALGSNGALQPSLSTAGTQIATEVTAIARASGAGENTRATLEVDVIDTNGITRQNLQVRYVRPFYEGEDAFTESIFKISTQKAKGVFDLGPWIMWVETLDGLEVSLRRRTFQIKSDTREVTLVVR